MKRIAMIIIILGIPLISQTPYDRYNVNEKSVFINEIKHEKEYKVNNTNVDSEIQYGVFRDGFFYFYDYNDKLSLIAMVNLKSSKFNSVDPKASKFPNESPYLAMGANPLAYIDPDGKEKVVVTGGEYDSDTRYKYNFVEPSITQLRIFRNNNKTETLTWAVVNKGYTDDDISEFEKIAEKYNANLVLVNSDQDLLNYFNSKSVTNSDKISKERLDDKITSIAVFGHGFSGSLELAYNQENSKNYSIETEDIKNLNKQAFDFATIYLYTCNAGTPKNGSSNFWTSFAGMLALQTKSQVYGYYGRTDYAKMNENERLKDKLNRFWNGFNTRGSISLPTSGTISEGMKSILYDFDRRFTISK